MILALCRLALCRVCGYWCVFPVDLSQNYVWSLTWVIHQAPPDGCCCDFFCSVKSMLKNQKGLRNKKREQESSLNATGLGQCVYLWRTYFYGAVGSVLEKWGMEGNCRGQARIKLKARAQSTVAGTESALIQKLESYVSITLISYCCFILQN